MIDTVVVLAKRPVPGRVKTRLTPPLSPRHAAEVAAAALTDTLSIVDGTPARRRVLAFDRPAYGWLPAGWQACTQLDGGLGRRIAGAFLAVGTGPALMVGMDTPQLLPAHLTAFDPDRYDACLGPATDGGYWALGMRDPYLAAAALAEVPMSTEHTGADQLRRLHDLGLRVQVLDELQDVDTFDDAQHVASLIPDSAFGRAVSRVRESLVESVR